MAYNRLETGKFSLESDKATDKLSATVEKALADNAAKGFVAPGGGTLLTILDALQESKLAVVEGNAKIYDERRESIFKVDEFALSYMVKLAKFAMELYREEIVDAIARDQMEWDAVRDRAKEDVVKRMAEIESRQASIIRDKAEMEGRIAVYKRQLVEAEKVTMGQEAILVQAQLSTAEKKLEIIDSIYQLLAAEELVLAAEKRKAASLQLVLEAQRLVAQVKQEMIPYIVDKANARKALAVATEQEIPILEALEKLGYDRIALRDAEEAEKHSERARELQHEMMNENLTRASASLELTRQTYHRLLLEYQNQIKGLILSQNRVLQEMEVDFKLATGLAREAVGVRNDITYLDRETSDTLGELSSLLANMELRALDETNLAREGGIRRSKSITDHLFSRRIREGFIVG